MKNVGFVPLILLFGGSTLTFIGSRIEPVTRKPDKNPSRLTQDFKRVVGTACRVPLKSLRLAGINADEAVRVVLIYCDACVKPEAVRERINTLPREQTVVVFPGQSRTHQRGPIDTLLSQLRVRSINDSSPAVLTINHATISQVAALSAATGAAQ